MTDDRLVVFEDESETGYVTATGETAYTGDNDYVASVLERFDGGVAEADRSGGATLPDELGGGTDTTTTARTVTGDDLFEYVRGRLSPLPEIKLELEDG